MAELKYYLRLILNIAAPIVALALLFLLGPKLVLFFLPFVLGYCIALIANPLVSYLQKHGLMKRKYSSVFMTILVLAVLIGLLYLAASQTLSYGLDFLKALPGYAQSFLNSIDELILRYTDVLEKLPPEVMSGIEEMRGNLSRTVTELLAKVTTPAFNFSLSAVRSVPGMFINTLIFFLSAFCFILEWENIQGFLRTHAPHAIEQYMTYLKQDLKKIFGSWLLAQFKIMFVVFAVLSAGFLLLHVRLAIPLAMLTAFLDFLPALGVGFIMWPWIALELLKGQFLTALWLTLIYIATQVVRHTLQPKIMGDTMGLPPLWTLFFLYLGFKLYGIAGMIFAVPIGMFFLSLYRYGIFDGMISAAKELIAHIGAFMHRD